MAANPQPEEILAQELDDAEIERLCSQSLRAIAQRPDLRISGMGVYSDDSFYPIRAVHLQLPYLDKNLVTVRAISDSMAQRIKHSVHAIHRSHLPNYRAGQEFLDLIEQLRVETLIGTSYPGIRQNLIKHFQAWAANFHALGHTETVFGSRFFSVAILIWGKLNNTPLPIALKPLIGKTLAPFLADIKMPLLVMERDRKDQAAFAESAVKIADILFANDDRIDDQAVADVLGEVKKASDMVKKQISDSAGQQHEVTIAADNDDGASVIAAKLKKKSDYKVFTTDYDQEVLAKEYFVDSDMAALRQQYTQLLYENYLSPSATVRKIKPYLSVPVRNHRSFGHDAGYIDGGRLTRIISNPNDKEIYWQFQDRPEVDAAVSLLIDCSAAMKPYHKEAALLATTLSKIVDKAGASTEVLGFTTSAWNGGQTANAWEAAGSPENPGRLNEQLHIVFKSAEHRIQHARFAMAAILNQSFYKESLPGEAIAWASARLKKLSVSRRFLVVITAGEPKDTLTTMINNDYYLKDHFKHEITEARKNGIRLCLLGMNINMTPYHRNSRVIRVGKDALDAQVEQFSEALKDAFAQ